MHKRWTVFDHELDKVVAFWFGDNPPKLWAKKYPHITVDGYERYSIESEYCCNLPSSLTE